MLRTGRTNVGSLPGLAATGGSSGGTALLCTPTNSLEGATTSYSYRVGANIPTQFVLRR